MEKELRWPGLVAINVQWLGISTTTGTITPLLLPFLVALYAPPDEKNTYLATVRVASLAVAMAVQPIAGLLSDRCTARWGRRRPYVVGGAIASLLFLFVIGVSPLLADAEPAGPLQHQQASSAAYVLLLLGIVLWQAATNVSQGGLQGLIPDLVPMNQRGRAAGVKSVMELFPVLIVIPLGPLVDAGKTGLVLASIGGILACTTLITASTVHEKTLGEQPKGRSNDLPGQVLRLIALALIFVSASQAAVWLVRRAAGVFTAWNTTLSQQALMVGLVGVLGMAGAILAGVYLGARVGLGRLARGSVGFVWWVINRLLFLAAVGSIQGFTLYYLGDVHNVAHPAALTTTVLVAVAAFLVPSALLGGYLSDRVGRRRLVALAGVVAASGTVLLILARSIAVVMVGASAIGAATGVFMATNWALGTDLVPAKDAGRYLGLSNMAGAGAGIIGAGIGGPLADSFNRLQSGLGYLVAFGVYAILFLLSVLALSQVPDPKVSAQQGAPPA